MDFLLEIVQLTFVLCFFDEEDSFIWQFTSISIYSSKSLYKVINRKGVIPMHVLAV